MKKLPENTKKDRTMWSARIPALTLKRLAEIAEDTERTNTDVIVDLIETYYAEHPPKAKAGTVDPKVRGELAALQSEFTALQKRLAAIDERVERTN